MPLVSITRSTTPLGVVQRLERERKDKNATSFAFFEIEFTNEIADTLISLLRQKSRGDRQQHLGELTFYSCPGNHNLNAVIQVALVLDLFTQIRIQGNKQTEYQQPALHSFGTQLKYVRNLTILNLRFLKIRRRDAIALRLGLENEKTKPCHPLEQLLLNNIEFVNDGSLEEIKNGLKSNKSLKVLALNSCGLTDNQMSLLLHGLIVHPKMRTLRLFGNHCRSNSLKAVTQILRNPQCKLMSLDIHHQFTSNRLNREDPNREEAPIEDRMKVQVLTERLQGGICRNKNLRRLVLSGNKLIDDDMKYLAIILRQLPYLQELDLDGNNITNHGLKLFAKYATVASRLRTLRLAENALTHEAAPALLQILKQQPELNKVIPSTYWKISSPLGNEIRKYLDWNRAGRVLLCRPSSTVALSVWPHVLARLNPNVRFWGSTFWGNNTLGDINGIYYLLRNGPVILEKEKYRSSDQETSSILSKKRGREGCEGQHERNKKEPRLLYLNQAM